MGTGDGALASEAILILFSLKNISVRFGGLLALSDFSMQVRSGSIHALIGPNGAGKSTVFNCISRFYTPFEGDISFDGQSLLKLRSHDIPALGIGRTFQHIELPRRLTVLENVLIGMNSRFPWYLPIVPSRARHAAERQAREQAESILEQTGLLAYRDKPAGELDFGHQKMLDVARALASRPRLLLLDEPAAGLRNREIANLNGLLKAIARDHGTTIVLVEHVMQFVMAIADRISVLNFGKLIAEGSPAEVRRNPAVIESYLGRSSGA